MSTLGKRCAGLRLGQADDADLRLGEHGGRHIGVIDRGRLAAEHSVGEGVTLADRNRRQVDPVGDVADRMDARRRGLRERIDRDAAVLGEPHAGRLETEPRNIRPPPGREHHAIDGEGFAIGQLDAEAVLDLLDRVDRLPGDDPDAAPLHLRAQMLAHVVVEAAQNIVAAIDQRHLGAEPMENAGELDRDIAAALDENALRQLLRGETPRWRR